MSSLPYQVFFQIYCQKDIPFLTDSVLYKDGTSLNLCCKRNQIFCSPIYYVTDTSVMTTGLNPTT